MANQQLAGLFGMGPQSSTANFLDNRELQRQARIQQAMQNYRGSGTAMAAARANQQGTEALTNLGRAALGSQGLGIQGMEDPKLALARKRDADRTEILKELEKFKANDGIIDDKEIQQGVALLSSKGYMDEAAKFQEQSLSLLRERRYAQGQSYKPRYAIVKDMNGNDRNVSITSTFVGGKAGRIITDINTGETINEIQGIPHFQDAQGMTSGGRVREKGLTQEAKDLATAGVDVKSEWGKKKLKYLEDGRNALILQSELGKARELAASIKSSGMAEGMTAFTGFFGKTPKNIEHFKHLMVKHVLAAIKQTGANPSDADRKFVEEGMAGLGKSTEGNLAIIDQMLSGVQRRVSTRKWISEHKTATEGEFDAAYDSFAFPTQSTTMTPTTSSGMTSEGAPSVGGGMSAEQAEAVIRGARTNGSN